jgi:hypothetical protein
MWSTFFTGMVWIAGIAVVGGFMYAFYDKWLQDHRDSVGNKKLKKLQNELGKLRTDVVELKKTVVEIRGYIVDLYIQEHDKKMKPNA